MLINLEKTKTQANFTVRAYLNVYLRYACYFAKNRFASLRTLCIHYRHIDAKVTFYFKNIWKRSHLFSFRDLYWFCANHMFFRGWGVTVQSPLHKSSPSPSSWLQPSPSSSTNWSIQLCKLQTAPCDVRCSCQNGGQQI